jgi:hypothetical protein
MIISRSVIHGTSIKACLTLPLGFSLRYQELFLLSLVPKFMSMRTTTLVLT